MRTGADLSGYWAYFLVGGHLADTCYTFGPNSLFYQNGGLQLLASTHDFLTAPEKMRVMKLEEIQPKGPMVGRTATDVKGCSTMQAVVDMSPEMQGIDLYSILTFSDTFSKTTSNW